MARKRRPTRERRVDTGILKDLIRRGVPWLPTQEQQLVESRHLSDHQQNILSRITPFKSVHRFLSGSQVPDEVVTAVERELRLEIERAAKRYSPSVKSYVPPKI